MTNNKTILITGTSSGIGKTTAIHLAERGFTVLATVRKESDAAMLKSYNLPNLIPIYPLDLTKSNEIESAVKTIVELLDSYKIPPLHGIVFNAGGGKIAPIELMKIEDFRNEIEKRVIGSIAILQNMLPYLRQANDEWEPFFGGIISKKTEQLKGRILWISTPALVPVPFVADIHACDFAVNYLSRTLNIELQPDGIKSILIRCGGINTPSPKRTENDIIGKLKDIPKQKIDIYRERLIKLEESLKPFSKKRTEPKVVAMTIEKALLAKKPKTRYQIGYMSKEGAMLERLPQSWVDCIMNLRK